MSPDIALLYLETDDEVTTVVRRLRETKEERIVLVAPGRSRATSSVVVLRLLARAGKEAGRSLAVVGDALTRSLAVEAGLEAYASVEDARNAGVASAMGPAPAEAPLRRAPIHVVRGTDPGTGIGAGALEVTAPIPTAATAAPLVAPLSDDRDLETRSVPAVRPSGPRPAAQRRPIIALLAVMAAVLASGALGVILLPAATIAITPRGEPLGPIPYEIEVPEPDRIAGTIEQTTPVTATGTYTTLEPATGTVVFFNWNTVAVEVADGTLVAAGEQAFATIEPVVIPAGELTGDGRIQAGEGGVGVVAAAVGPAANVAPNAIDTVVSSGTAGRLRGFPNNSAALVVNPEATSGGIDASGPEITQADVDAAVAVAGEALAAGVAEALGEDGNAVFADAAGPAEPIFAGLAALVGTRDQAEAQITGTLGYDRLLVDRAEIVATAEARLATDPAALPEGHGLTPGATEVTIGEARRDGDMLVVSVRVNGASAAAINRDEVIARVRGHPLPDAEQALDALGDATVTLWPAWVASVPGIEWRIDVQITGAEEGPLPSASASLAP